MRRRLRELSTPEIETEIGAALAKSREALGWEILEAADRSGLHRNTISKIERGGGAQLSSVIRLLRAYGELHRLDALLAESISPLRIAERALEEDDG